MDDKIYTQEVVAQNPFPGQAEQSAVSSMPSNTNNNYSSQTTKSKPFPIKRTAVELLSSALNTRSKKILQEFQLQQSGGIQVGDFKEGISGDLRITPNGLTARDIAGLTTFAIDGLTGDAFFRGIIQAASFIGENFLSGAINIDPGGLLLLDSGADIELYAVASNDARIRFLNRVNDPPSTIAEIYADATGGALFIKQGDVQASLNLGDTAAIDRFLGIGIYAEDDIILSAKAGSNQVLFNIEPSGIYIYFNSTQIAELRTNGDMLIAGTLTQNHVF